MSVGERDRLGGSARDAHNRERDEHQVEHRTLSLPKERHLLQDKREKDEPTADIMGDSKHPPPLPVKRPSQNLIAANIYDKYSIGPSNRPICTRRCFTMTSLIQVCGHLR